MHRDHPEPSFTIVDGIALARVPAGPWTFPQAVAAVERILLAAVASGFARVAVDATAVHGMKPPSIGQRHAMVRTWADAAAGRLVVAVACAPELIDAERFGVVAAANFGLRSNVFANVDEALAWLRLQ